MFKRKRSSEDFAEEIKSHLDLEADALKREGLNDAEARRAARREFGNVTIAVERFNLRGRWLWLDKLLRDLRFGLRSLRQSPGFTLTAILTLALGMGANTAVFSVMNAVLLRSLPVANPQQVVYLQTSGPPNHADQTGNWETSFSYPVYQALRQQKDVLSDVIACIPLSIDKVGVRTGTQPEGAEIDMVSGDFFSGLGVQLIRGRGFTQQDEDTSNSVAVISYNFWTREFSRNPSAIGKTIFIKGLPFTITGIAAEGFEGVEGAHSTDLWIPLQTRPELGPWGATFTSGKNYKSFPEWWFIPMLARLAPGVTQPQAISRLQPIYRQAAYIGIGSGPQAGEKPTTLSFAPAKLFPGGDDEYGKPLRILMVMVGFVLLIALTNVVMLLMARNATRQREFSLRLALGARRSELLRQLLTESLLLATAGAIVGWLFARLATRTLAQWAHIEASLAPDRTVLLVTLGILAFAAILFGLAPFKVAIAGGAELALKTSAATSSADAGKTRLGKTIVALQMALCVVLLVGGGLLVRTLNNLQNIPLGMKTEGLVVFGINPQSLHNNADGVLFYQDLLRRMRTLPGVTSATLMDTRIGSGWSSNNDAVVDGVKITLPDNQSVVRSNDVAPDFFNTLGIPLIAGRDFNDSDTATSAPVAIVNELFVKRFLPNQSPLGHRLGSHTIIGVVKDNKYAGMQEKPVPMAWYDYVQGSAQREMHIELRVVTSSGDPLAILPTVQRTIAQIDPNLALIEPITQRAQFEQSISPQLMFARLAEFFGLLAIVLVATGLYGTLAYRVSRRTAEIGVRMAVGAQRSQVVWMVLRDSLILTAAGVLLGIPLALGVSHYLTSSLYGVQPFDLLSYILAVLGVAIVALIASAVPAGRAANVDPITALHTD